MVPKSESQILLYVFYQLILVEFCDQLHNSNRKNKIFKSSTDISGSKDLREISSVLKKALWCNKILNGVLTICSQ